MTFDSIIESCAAAAKVIQNFLGGEKLSLFILATFIVLGASIAWYIIKKILGFTWRVVKGIYSFITSFIRGFCRAFAEAAFADTDTDAAEAAPHTEAETETDEKIMLAETHDDADDKDLKPWRRSDVNWDMLAADPARQEREAKSICAIFGGRFKYDAALALVREGILDIEKVKMMMNNEMSSRLIE